MGVARRAAVVIAVSAMGLLSGAGPVQGASRVDPSTAQDALAAMHGEAFAHAKYRAYASEAVRTGKRDIARLFAATAREELGEHFDELGELIGFVGTNVDNLRGAIEGEIHEAEVMYPDYARQATADGCEVAAALFTEIAADERRHADLFQQALRALTYPGSGPVPVGEAPPPVPIPRTEPACPARTQTNLLAAMRGEAFASAKYLEYADRAERSGQLRLARLFRNAAQMELGEHFAEQAALAGLVGGDRENLRDAVAGEVAEATELYPSFAARAFGNGDYDAAARFLEIATDELGHATAFQEALASHWR